MGRAARSIAIAGACWAVVANLPDIARYVRMREMSRPGHRPAPDAPAAGTGVAPHQAGSPAGAAGAPTPRNPRPDAPTADDPPAGDPTAGDRD